MGAAFGAAYRVSRDPSRCRSRMPSRCVKMGARRRETLCIGDQLITDVWGGHFMRMPVYMVEPLVSVDLKHTLLLRHVEALFMKNIHPEK